MKYSRLFSILALLLLPSAARLQAAQAEIIGRLDQALSSLTAFEYGKDAGALQQLETLVFEASNDAALQPVVEERLLRVLSGSATRDAKEFICRQLFTIGSDRSVPELERLLSDPGLSHMARYALERNESPAAAAALLRALSKTSGKAQAGILNSLGRRRYGPAVKECQELLAAEDQVVAEAAAGALGMIGTLQSTKALETGRLKAAPSFRFRIDEALLVGADHLLAQGNKTAAGRIYADLYSTNRPPSLRLAALRGMLAAGDSRAISALAQAIKGADARFAVLATGLVPVSKAANATQKLADLLPSLESNRQELLLKALASRKDPNAARTAAQFVKSSSPEVRTAALEALGSFGTVSEVDILLNAAATATGREQLAARSSLVQIGQADSGNPVNSALLARIGAASRDPKIQVEAIRALAARRVGSAVPALLETAVAKDSNVRQESLRALGVLVEPAQAEAFAELGARVDGGKEQQLFEEALVTVLQRIKTPEQRAAPLLAALTKMPAEKKTVLIPLLPYAATSDTLGAAQKALQSSDPALHSAALRALAEWPNSTPAELLLGQVQASAAPVDKVIALRGYIRMAGLSKDPAGMYARALQLAERPEDKRLVLSGLGSAEPMQALQLIQPFFQSPDLRNEAAQSAVQIADRLRPKDPVRAKAVAKQALTACTEARIRQQAQEVINQVEQFEGYILEWVGAGPFQAEGKDAHFLFETPFGPEQAGAKVTWVKLARGIGAWDINLGEAMGGGDDVVGYLRTKVFSPVTQEARMELGSDDGIKVWLNDAVVLSNNTERGIAPRQDTVKVKLNEGWNSLLLKVTNRGGGWNAACRIRQPDGSAIEGLKLDASAE